MTSTPRPEPSALETSFRTHWDGCWEHRGHHECAIARVRELEAESAPTPLGEYEPRPTIERILRAYHCQHTVDDEGGGLPLVDALSPGDAIDQGIDEIHLIADAIAAQLVHAGWLPVGAGGRAEPPARGPSVPEGSEGSVRQQSEGEAGEVMETGLHADGTRSRVWQAGFRWRVGFDNPSWDEEAALDFSALVNDFLEDRNKSAPRASTPEQPEDRA